MREIIESAGGFVTRHYWVNERGGWEGIARMYHGGTDMLYSIRCWKDDHHYGEWRRYRDDGVLDGWGYDIHSARLHLDFLLNPISDEERMLLVLKYGGQLLPKVRYVKRDQE